jgi:hypothetical protein
MLAGILELPAEYAWVEFGVIVFSFLILIAGVCWSIHNWQKMRKPAQLEAWFLENPLNSDRERYVTSLRVPSDANLILYHLIKTEDYRELTNVSVIVKYPKEIEIQFRDKTYRWVLQYGRKVISRGKHEAVVQFGGQTFVKGQIDKLPFPLLLDTSRAHGSFPVTLTITFTGAGKAVEKRLMLDVCDSDFSYDKSLFSASNSQFTVP